MSLIKQTLFLVHTFSNRHVCSWRHFLGYLYSRFSHFFKNNENSPHTAYHFIFVRLFCKLSSSGSSDSYHFEGTRSVLSWETIVHYPRYKLRGQIRLKDTTLSLGSDLLFNHGLYYRFVSFKYFMFLTLNEHGNYKKMSESTYLQPLLRNRGNWKTRNILVLLNPSQKQLDGDFSLYF